MPSTTPVSEGTGDLGRSPADAGSLVRERRRSRSARGLPSGALSRGFRRTSAWLLTALIGACPLLAGSVHRPAVLSMLAATSVAFFCVLAGERLRDRSLRGAGFSIVFILLVVLPLLQLVPLPMALRRAIDPTGSALLDNAPEGTPARWPLSLDPQSTAEEVGTAAVSLIVFAMALHFATARRYRRLFIKAIAGAGIVGVVSGIVHRLAGLERLYGLFNVYGAVLPGPFINPNHSAEFYELAAFASLALALGAEAEERIAWYAAAAVNAAATLTTLSRGSFLGLFAGGTVFVALRLRADRDADPTPERRSGVGSLAQTLVWCAGALACLVSIAVALGAAPVLDELARTNLTGGTEKTVVWRDALPLLWHFPMGIGRHAFDRVYPVYKTLAQNSRFQFVENGPLQLLIDFGWPGLALLVIALVLTIRRLPVRRDYVAAAMIAGLMAVLAHNVVDFGLETMGIRVPFAAMAGMLVGRALGQRDGEKRPEARGWRRADIIIIATATVGLAIGLRAELRRGAHPLEEQWRQAPRGEGRREIALQGGRTYPTDFYFPLLQSYDEPLRPARAGGVSPRLSALNRSLRLCPGCAAVYEQAAQSLLQLDLRAQSLAMFRKVVDLQPARTLSVLVELDAKHFAPVEMATLGGTDSKRTLDVARYLVAKKAEPEVTALLAQAARQGAPASECLLIRSRLLLGLGRLNEAEKSLREGLRLAPRDGRFEDALSDAAEREGRPEEALQHARAATTLSPSVVEFARHRVRLVVQLHQWPELDGALEHLKLTLRQNGQNVTEVHLTAGRVQEARGNLARALSEYRTAAAVDGANPVVWDALAHVAEARGDLHAAIDAYRRVAALRPDDPAAQQSVVRAEKALEDANLQQLFPGR